MKLVLAFFLGLASQGWAVCASGTLAYYNPPGSTELCGGGTLVQTGSPGMSNTNCYPGAGSVPLLGSAAAYFQLFTYTASTSTNMVVGMRAATAYTIEFYAYKITRTANTYPMSFSTAGADNTAFQIGDAVSDNARMTVNGVQMWLYADTGALGNCVYYRVEATGSYSRLLMGVNGGAPAVVTGVASSGLFVGNEDEFSLGNVAGFVYGGTVTGLRFSNIIQPSIPTTDPTSARGTRSPYWQNGIRPNIIMPPLGVR